MPRPIIKGTLGKVRKSIKTKFDKSSGLSVTTEWQSAGDNLNGYARALRDLGIQYEHSVEASKSSLVEISDGPSAGLADLAIDRWEVLANENMLDLKEHGNWAGLDAEQRAEVLFDVRKHEDGKNGSGAYLDPDSWSDDEITIADSFYNLMIRGVTHYPVYNWVLRHTTNVSAEYTQNVADSGVGSIYSTSQLISEISDSGFWVYPCPPRLRSKIAGISAPIPVVGLTWGWIKKPSNEASAANNRIDISTEYVLAQWPNILYG